MCVVSERFFYSCFANVTAIAAAFHVDDSLTTHFVRLRIYICNKFNFKTKPSFFGVSAEIKRVIQIHRGRKFAFRSEKKEVLRLHTFATRLHENSKNTAQTRSEQKLVIQIGRLFFCSAFATHYVFICVQIISYYISFSFSYALRFFCFSCFLCLQFYVFNSLLSEPFRWCIIVRSSR